MRKEYGGYLPLELRRGKAWYDGPDTVALNAGRYAAAYALKDGGWNGALLPYYLCGTVEAVLKGCLPGLKIRYYHIGKDLLPEEKARPGEDECLLWVNYFGIQPDTAIDRMARAYGGQLLIDNTQSFFTKPRKQAYQIYSCRKFFGVCDGAYAVHEGIRHETLPKGESGGNAAHLLESLEHGTDYSYARNKENEERLGHDGMTEMSPLTKALMEAADYGYVRTVRQRNMELLHEMLGKANMLPLSFLGPAMNYPFLSKTEGLRERLTRRRIYVPWLWQETLENPFASEWEKELSSHLCLLPVDQRYDEEDMRAIADAVLCEENVRKESL